LAQPLGIAAPTLAPERPGTARHRPQQARCQTRGAEALLVGL